MAFIVELWDSIFTPGTTPALITATHVSFILLILSLIALIFLSGSYHFYNLLAIAVLLYASVIWFINELKNVKLKTNEELEAESKAENEKSVTAPAEEKAAGTASTTTATAQTSPIKKRKT
ncbi:SMK killer toxin resistance protein [Scheffersomyces xylosifermentans]|uniref:SMK killer toxin resistance protein n=1 Tax=Scheffersomyces xylosifermentans TaxID=1304137 RepID=UPI00315DB5AF